jgi:hypothetical protein
MSKSLEPCYRKSLDERWSMRFKTRHPDGDNYDGVIVHLGQQFVVIREQTDFEFDGIIVLPKRVVRGVRDGEFERCANEILRQNGALGHLKVPLWVRRCVTMWDILESLMKRSIWPGIEILFGDGSTAFYLGPIESISKDGFETKCYDAAGEWEDQYSFRWKEIFKVEIASKYCTHFNRYMRAKIR